METNGIKITHSGGTNIFIKKDYNSEEEYSSAWLQLTRKLEQERKWFLADPIYKISSGRGGL